MVLDLEDPGMRPMRLGTRALFCEKIISSNEGSAKVAAVKTCAVVCDLAQTVLDAPAIDVAVGPVGVSL